MKLRFFIIFLLFSIFTNIYSSDGSLDTTFGGTGIVTSNIAKIDIAFSVIVVNNKVIITGNTRVGGLDWVSVLSYNNDGTLNTGFNGTGIFSQSVSGLFENALSAAAQSDNKIVIAGFAGGSFLVARLNADGTLDTTTFNSPNGFVTTAIGFNAAGNSVAIQTNGQIVVAGTSDNQFAVARYNSDGSLDTAGFGSPNGFVITPVGISAAGNSVAIQANGQIVVGGTSDGQFALARYNTDGSLDTAGFGSPNGFVTTAIGASALGKSIAIQSNGQIVVGGTSDNQFAAARYNTDGSLDTVGFGSPNGFVITPVGATALGRSLSLQPDEKIVVVGESDNQFALVRYNTNGVLDSTFGTAGIVTTIIDAASSAFGSYITPNFKILAAGTTSTNNGDFATARYLGDTVAPIITITSPINGSTTPNNKPPITGTTEPGATVEVKIDTVSIGFAVVDGSGNWTITPVTALSEGMHTAMAIATDAAGNSANVSVTFTVDTTAPFVTILSPANGSITNNNQPPISGTTQPGATVEVQIDAVSIGFALVDGSGNWSITPGTPLSDASHTATAIAMDLVGNTSMASVTFTVDTTAPDLAIIFPVNGSVINNPQPTIMGTTEPGATVEVKIDSVSIGFASVDGSGNWLIMTPTPLAPGSHTVTATAQDSVGNIAIAGITFSISSTAPFLALSFPGNNALLYDPNLIIRGMSNPGSTITINLDGVNIGSTTTSSAGIFIFPVPFPLSTGVHVLIVTTTDSFGNTATVIVTFTVCISNIFVDALTKAIRAKYG